MKKRNERIQGLKEKRNRIEDEIFADFCQQIGVSNIRSEQDKFVKILIINVK